MRPEIWQTISQLAIALGIIITALGGYGAYHFGKVTDRAKEEQGQKRETKLTENIDSLVQGNKDLQGKLQPFENLANKMYPGIETDAALGRLSREIQDVKKEMQPTVLIPSVRTEKELPNGSVEYTFSLEPEGANVIPILAVSAESIDGVKINSINIQGNTLPPMAETRSNNELTSQRILYRSVMPTSFKVVINTAKKTQLKISITPLKSER